MKKTILILGIIFLLAGISLNPAIAVFNSNDDTTLPVTTHSLDPSTPDGENGWYVSDVNVTLNATDDISGVNITYYRVNSGEWEVYNSTFIISEDGDDILIEYYSIDNADNQETIKQASIDMDQTTPVIDLSYECETVDKENGIYEFIFDIRANDKTSKMNRVELLVEGKSYEIIYGPGPDYIFYLTQDYDISIKGFICKRNITDEYVKFYAILISEFWIGDTFYHLPGACAYDNAGNYKIDELTESPEIPEIKTFTWYKFPNDYKGTIGSYHINAIFKKIPVKVTIVPNLLNFKTNNLFLRFLDHFPLLHRLLDIWRLNLL